MFQWKLFKEAPDYLEVLNYGGYKMAKKKEETSEKKGPIVEHRISKSKDGKWVMLKTIITEIKSANYLKEVLKDWNGLLPISFCEMTNSLEYRCKKAILKIADSVEDISLKLSHLIDYQKKEYFKGASDYYEY